MSRSILDLKDPKNHKINNHSFNDVLNSNQLTDEEYETGPAPINSEDNKIDQFLKEAPEGFDKNDQVPDNSPNMAPFTTLTSLSWISPERHHELISHAWRKVIIVILAGMAFLALFWQGSVLTAVTFFALALTTSMHFWREAQYHKYEIHPHGIMASDKFYHYRDLDSFWIHYHPEGYHELSLCTGKLANYYIKIPFRDQDPFEIRQALAMYLPEEKHEEGLEDLLRRKLGL